MHRKQYIMNEKRTILKAIDNYRAKYPIVAITGPRQSGKTTFLKHHFAEYRYVNLENPDMNEFAKSDPKGFLRIYDSKVIFDEVQKVPELFSYLQAIVDESGQMGQFFLSGSQNFQLVHRITQSLAGRVALFRLFPFDFDELKSKGWLSTQFEDLILKGFYPAIYDRNIDSVSFYRNYIQTYVERDITDLVNIRDISLFRKFLSLCASRAGQLLNLNAIANECGISQPTAKSWLSLLESSYIVFLLQPYYQNFNKRVVKTPKLYFVDSGLLCYLLKVKTITQFNKGMLFENLLISELYKQSHHRYIDADFWFWRNAAGQEVDLLIQQDEQVDTYEIKCTETIQSDLFNGLNKIKDDAGSLIKSQNLLYAGKDTYSRLGTKILSWNDMNLVWND